MIMLQMYMYQQSMQLTVSQLPTEVGNQPTNRKKSHVSMVMVINLCIAIRGSYTKSTVNKTWFAIQLDKNGLCHSNAALLIEIWKCYHPRARSHFAGALFHLLQYLKFWNFWTSCPLMFTEMSAITCKQVEPSRLQSIKGWDPRACAFLTTQIRLSR